MRTPFFVVQSKLCSCLLFIRLCVLKIAYRLLFLFFVIIRWNFTVFFREISLKKGACPFIVWSSVKFGFFWTFLLAFVIIRWNFTEFLGEISGKKRAYPLIVWSRVFTQSNHREIRLFLGWRKKSNGFTMESGLF